MTESTELIHFVNFIKHTIYYFKLVLVWWAAGVIGSVIAYWHDSKTFRNVRIVDIISFFGFGFFGGVFVLTFSVTSLFSEANK